MGGWRGVCLKRGRFDLRDDRSRGESVRMQVAVQNEGFTLPHSQHVCTLTLLLLASCFTLLLSLTANAAPHLHLVVVAVACD